VRKWRSGWRGSLRDRCSGGAARRRWPRWGAGPPPMAQVLSVAAELVLAGFPAPFPGVLRSRFQHAQRPRLLRLALGRDVFQPLPLHRPRVGHGLGVLLNRLGISRLRLNEAGSRHRPFPRPAEARVYQRSRQRMIRPRYRSRLRAVRAWWARRRRRWRLR